MVYLSFETPKCSSTIFRDPFDFLWAKNSIRTKKKSNLLFEFEITNNPIINKYQFIKLIICAVNQSFDLIDVLENINCFN